MKIVYRKGYDPDEELEIINLRLHFEQGHTKPFFSSEIEINDYRDGIVIYITDFFVENGKLVGLCPENF